jgi:hypothetical protein
VAAALELVLDCVDAETLARFWAAALGYRPVGEAGQYRALGPPDGETGPRLILQQVDEPRAAKNRMHLDVLSDDPEAEATRLAALGATRGDRIREHGHDWIQMRDPEGNEFCVCAC